MQSRWAGFDNTQSVCNAQVLTAASSANASDEGVVLYKTSDNAMPSVGVGGIVAPRYIRSIYMMPGFKLLWSSVGGHWGNW